MAIQAFFDGLVKPRARLRRQALPGCMGGSERPAWAETQRPPGSHTNTHTPAGARTHTHTPVHPHGGASLFVARATLSSGGNFQTPMPSNGIRAGPGPRHRCFFLCPPPSIRPLTPSVSPHRMRPPLVRPAPLPMALLRRPGQCLWPSGSGPGRPPPSSAALLAADQPPLGGELAGS